MNDDLQFEKNGIVFNYRVAVIIRNGNKILVQMDKRRDYFSIPGGRCKLEEDSAATAYREFFEETGIKTEFVKAIGMVENFFLSSFNNKNYHEILIINELKFQDSKLYEKDTFGNIEEGKKEFVEYIWKDIDELRRLDFRPNIALDMLSKNEFVHLINREI